MVLQNGLEIADSAIQKYFIRLTNQIYKLLPSREEDFLLYRRTIFECLGIMNEVAEDVNRQY